MRERDIFIEALQKPSPGDRAAYLHTACGPDADLLSRVERLLLEHHRQESFILDSPATAVEAGLPLDADVLLARPGTIIGRYKLLEPIGEGGYGSVFMAEQTTPVQRKVALKIIKAGMDTRQVIARFEAERQALALMDHPNIAKVFDAGVTDAGRPYFVMELVKGMAITKYCDEHHLAPRQRLELFVQVCQAVQHAHQKGIIHRDIKPTNVLVAQYDGKPVPKVIDFGVAKATGQKLTGRTMFTGFGDVIGTLEYMSPEQAEVNQLDVDTRSDIYSLGVLLYELLTGSTPLENKRVKKAALLEMLRVIREEEPPKPSTRLSTSEYLPSIAANRGLEPKKLSGLVHGELDWIVMKALEKDRGRRYDTANGFAKDIERYLNDDTVQACPPSAVYRFRKFARRNRAALAGGVLLTVAAMVALSAVGWAVRDRAARQQLSAHERTARQAKVTGQLDLILEEVARLQQAQKWSEALTSARRAEPALAGGEAAPVIQERVRQTLKDLELVRRLDEIRAASGTVWVEWSASGRARHRSPVTAEQYYAAAFREAGIDVDALSAGEAVKRIVARPAIAAALLPALDDWVAVRSMATDDAAAGKLIDIVRGADPDPWRQQMRDALAGKDWHTLTKLATSAELDRQPATTLSSLYAILSANDALYLERELVLRRAQWKYPGDYWINHRLGVDLIWRKKPEYVQEGIAFMRAAVALRPKSAHSIMNLGNGYLFLGQRDAAIAFYRKAIELNPKEWGPYSNLAETLNSKGSHDDAIATLEQAIVVSPCGAAYAELSLNYSDHPELHRHNASRATELATRAIELEPDVSNHWTALGIARYRQGQWQEARAALEKSGQLKTRNRWKEAIDSFFRAMCHQQLGQEDAARQCYDKAVAWMESNAPDDVRLIRLRGEARELLGLAMHPASQPVK